MPWNTTWGRVIAGLPGRSPVCSIESSHSTGLLNPSPGSGKVWARFHRSTLVRAPPIHALVVIVVNRFRVKNAGETTPGQEVVLAQIWSNGTSGQFVAVDALKAGAASYFPKDKVRHHRLVDAIRAEMRTAAPGEDTGSLLVNHKAMNGERKRRLPFLPRRTGLITSEQGDVVLLGSRHSPGTLRVREFLTRNGHPHSTIDVDTDSV